MLASLNQNRASAALLFLSLGCQGEIVVPMPDAGDASSSTVPDASGTPDADTPDLALPPDPLCTGVFCPANSVCGRGICWCAPGFMGDPNTGCTPGNPCAEVTCQFGSTCNDRGECPCDPEFVDDGVGGCEAPFDQFPLERTPTDVCARWLADYPETAGVRWQEEPPDKCSPGQLDPAFVMDAVRRVSLYRWLVGLPAVTTSPGYAELTQACATVLDAENAGATNDIADTFACYSADAAAGASGSSVLRGAPSPAAAVDTFVEDAAAASLGNRRWIFGPQMGATGFGFRGNYTCMYAIDVEASTNPQYIAYPFGVFPTAALRGRWMWASGRLFTSDATTVTVLDASGAAVPVSNLTRLAGNVVPAALAWDVAGPLAPGMYTVTLQGLSGAMNELTYPVTLVDCQ